jgi:hypothetical protein
LAEDFLRAATHLAATIDSGDLSVRFTRPLYHLHAHSMELALKALLLAHGVSEPDLRKKYRHGFEELWDPCIKFKMRSKKPKKTAEVVETIGELVQDRRFRYYETGHLRLPELAEVQAANARILDAVRRECARASFVK